MDGEALAEEDDATEDEVDDVEHDVDSKDAGGGSAGLSTSHPLPSVPPPPSLERGASLVVSREQGTSEFVLPRADDDSTHSRSDIDPESGSKGRYDVPEDDTQLDSPAASLARRSRRGGDALRRKRGAQKLIENERGADNDNEEGGAHEGDDRATWLHVREYFLSLPATINRALVVKEGVKATFWTPTRIWIMSACTLLQEREMWTTSLSMQLLGLLCAFTGEIVAGGARYNVPMMLVLMAAMRFPDFPDKTMRPQLMITTLTCLTLLLDASIILSSDTFKGAAAKATAAFTGIAKIATLYEFLLVAKNAPKARKYFIRRVRVFFVPLHRPRNPMRELRARILAIEWIEFIAAIVFFILFIIGVTSFAHLSFVSEPSAGVGMIAFLPIKALTTGLVAYALLTDTDIVLCMAHFGCMNSFMGYVKRYVLQKYEELDGWPLSYGLNPYRFYAIIALKCFDVIWGFTGLAALFSSTYLGGGGGIPDPNIKAYVDFCLATVLISDIYVGLLLGIVYWLIQENRRRLEIVLHTKSNGEYEATYEGEDGSDDSELDDLGFRTARNAGQIKSAPENEDEEKGEFLAQSGRDDYVDVELARKDARSSKSKLMQLRDPEAFSDMRSPSKNMDFTSQFASPTRVDRSRRLQLDESQSSSREESNGRQSRVVNASRYDSVASVAADEYARRGPQRDSAKPTYADDGYIYEDQELSEPDEYSSAAPLSPSSSSSIGRGHDRYDERQQKYSASQYDQFVNRSRSVGSSSVERQDSDYSRQRPSYDHHVSSDSAHGLVDDEIADSSSVPFEFSVATEDKLSAEPEHRQVADAGASAPSRASGNTFKRPLAPHAAASPAPNKSRKDDTSDTDAFSPNIPTTIRRLPSLQRKPQQRNADSDRNHTSASLANSSAPNTFGAKEKRTTIHLMPQYLVSADQFSAMWESLPMSSSDSLTFSALTSMTYDVMKAIASKHFHTKGFKIMASGVTGAGVTLYIYGASVQTRPDAEDSDIVVFVGEIRIWKEGTDDIWALSYVCKCTDSAHSTAFFRLLDLEGLLSSPGLDDL